MKHLQPRLTMQVWDNDLFNPDDFLGEFTPKRKHLLLIFKHFSGTMDINLLSMPEGAHSARSCDLDMFPDPGNPDHKCKSKMVSIFQKKRVRGF